MMSTIQFYLSRMKSRYFMLIACFALFMGAISCSSDDFEGYGPEEDVPETERREVIWTIKSVDGTLPGTRGVAVTDKLWESGDTIRIKFLNGTLAEQQSVQLYADIWLQYANLVFQYVAINEYADVKIGFDMDSRYLAWSTIGTDCRQIPQNEPSLNFVDLEYYLIEDVDFARGEILRGFGHILGLGFEHQNPTSPVVFNDKALNQLMSYHGLSADDVNNHILPYYTINQTNYTAYDRTSIMVLALTIRMLVNPSEATNPNNSLSSTDIAFISNLYPYPSMPGVLINGVYWAMCNIDSPGRFAATPESTGRYYQWNRKKAWIATGPFNDWGYTMPVSGIWEAANDPSPAGWRIPDTTDFNKLMDTTKVIQVSTTLNGVIGSKFTDMTSGNSIFLPAAGMIYFGNILHTDLLGYYWSASFFLPKQNIDEAWAIAILAHSRFGPSYVANALPIRCVRD